MMLKLGNKINQLRKGKGLSQEELAAQLAVSRQAISKWELGESIPDVENIVQLGKLFNVSMDYLLNDAIENEARITTAQGTTATPQVESRRNAMLFGFFLISAMALIVSTVVWMQNWLNRGFIMMVCFLVILAVCFCVEFFYVSQLSCKKQKKRNRRNIYSIGALFILPIPIWTVVQQGMIYYPRPFLYGMQYLAFMIIYLVSAVVVISTIQILGRRG